MFYFKEYNYPQVYQITKLNELDDYILTFYLQNMILLVLFKIYPQNQTKTPV